MLVLDKISKPFIFTILIVLMSYCGPSISFGNHVESCKHPNLNSKDQVLREFAQSVFKVYILKGNRKKFNGTATLIHQEGYLITAKHVVNSVGENVVYLRRSDPSGNDYEYVAEVYENKNKETNSESPKEEADSNKEKSAPLDIKLLKVKVEYTNDFKSVPIVDLFFENIESDKLYFMLGYAKRERMINKKREVSITLEPSDGQTMGAIYSSGFELPGGAIGGQSGSLALNRRGQAIGVMRGDFFDQDKHVHPKTTRFFHYIVSFAELMEIKSSYIQDLEEKLKNGKLIDGLLMKKINQLKLTSIDLVQLTKFFIDSKQDEKIKIWLEQNWVSFEKSLRCKGLFQTSIFLASELDIKTTTPPWLKLYVARKSLNSYRERLKKGKINTDDFTKLNGKQLIEIYNNFEKAANYNFEKNPRFANIFFFEKGVLVNEVRNYEPNNNISKSTVEKNLGKSISYNKEDWRARHYLSRFYSEKKDYVKAAKEVRIILENYKKFQKEKQKNTIPITLASNLFYELASYQNILRKKNRGSEFTIDLVEKNLKSSINLNSKNWKPYHSLVEIYNEKGDYQKAVAAAQTAYQYNPPKKMKYTIAQDWKNSLEKSDSDPFLQDVSNESVRSNPMKAIAKTKPYPLEFFDKI